MYVTGDSDSDFRASFSDFDYATIKYDTNGNRLWVKRYDWPGNEDDGARALLSTGRAMCT